MGRLITTFLLSLVIFFFEDSYIQSQFKLIKEYIENYFFIRLIDSSIDIIGNGGYQAAFCIFLFAVGMLFRKKRLSYAGKYGLFSLLTASVIVQFLKHLIGRARPRLDNAYLFIGPSIKDGFDSFPSGHAFGAFTLAVIFSNVYPRSGIIFYGIASTISLWRLYDNSHFLSDVFAGMFLGMIIGRWFLNKYPHKYPPESAATDSKTEKG
ncbi:MAG: phosphatase PAP2 family protein [Nitrospinae bacterium]|nr:phosphatase PAP2 family protein [Nitrospinota bacterium]